MTPPAPPSVTQADREAAASFWEFMGQAGSAELCRQGKGFRNTAEHFARHRTTAEAASAARVAELLHVAGDLLQHIDWLTNGLPAMLENAALTDEEGLIGAAVDAANSARALLVKHQQGEGA